MLNAILELPWLTGMCSVQKQMLDLLEGWLRHKSDMVNLEAARVICELKNVSSQQLTRSIAGKQFLYLTRRMSS